MRRRIGGVAGRVVWGVNENVLEGEAQGGEGRERALARPPLLLQEFDDDGGAAWRFNIVMSMIASYWCMGELAGRGGRRAETCVKRHPPPTTHPVMTNWASPSGHSGVSGGTSVMWLNGTASWMCSEFGGRGTRMRDLLTRTYSLARSSTHAVGIYTWTIIAPAVCPGRDWS